MNLKIESGIVYADNLILCKAGAGNGRSSLPTGCYEVTTQYSGEHGSVLPNAVGLGWLGANPGCDVVLGGVRGRDGVIPSPSVLGRMLAMLEVAEGAGQKIMLEVK